MLLLYQRNKVYHSYHSCQESDKTWFSKTQNFASMFNSQSKTKHPEDESKAYEYAVYLLSLKLRSVGEVLAKMTGRGFSQKVIEQTLSRLKSQKYLDDETYAKIFLENLKAYRNFGYYGIKKKFMEKKLPSDVIDRVLSEGFSKQQERKIAERLLKKEGFTTKPSPQQSEQNSYRSFDGESGKLKNKLANKLKSRGFRPDIISSLLFQ